ncbi:MAG: sugar ABC transporter ATP-binding protein [Phycisphaerales bacterium]
MSSRETAHDRRSADAPSALLEARGLTKSFPGVKALNGVDFTLRAGEIHALMGENGAGKSTLVKALTGVSAVDSGSMRFDGRPFAPRSPHDAGRLGVAAVFQEINLIPQLSVAENIALGRMSTRFGRVRWRAVNDDARRALKRLNLTIDVTRPLDSYPIAIQQMVAIARALCVDARILILDEPTSSLDAKETDLLFAVMRRLRADGLGIVFITHFLDQVYEISDRITVLRNGRLVGAFTTARLPRLELIAGMLGRSVEAAARLTTAHRTRPTEVKQEAILRAEGLGRRGAIESFDLEIQRGEVVGLAGLLGSGRTELARLVFGADRADRGSVRVAEFHGRWRSPRSAIRRGLAFCPEDRKTDGVAPHLSVRENIALALQARYGFWRPLSRRRQNELTERFIRALNIATPDAEKPVGRLSGGNQQKVILARWLASEPQLLILDEPTRGIDVGAKAEIERLISKLGAGGMAILFISSELEEVARDSHRVVVLRDRRVIGELRGDEIRVDSIMRLIARTNGEAVRDVG